MKEKSVRYRKVQLLGMFGALLLFLGGAVGVEAAPQEPYKPQIPLGLDEEAFK